MWSNSDTQWWLLVNALQRSRSFWASPSWASEYNVWAATKEVTGQTVGPLGLATGEREGEWGSFLAFPSSRSKEHFSHLHCQDHPFLASLLYSPADVTMGSPFSSGPHPWLHIRITGERGLYSMLGCHLQGYYLIEAWAAAFFFLIPQVILPERTDGNRINSEARWSVSDLLKTARQGSEIS